MNKHEGRLFSMYSFDYVACQGINNNGAIGPLFIFVVEGHPLSICSLSVDWK